MDRTLAVSTNKGGEGSGNFKDFTAERSPGVRLAAKPYHCRQIEIK